MAYLTQVGMCLFLFVCIFVFLFFCLCICFVYLLVCLFFRSPCLSCWSNHCWFAKSNKVTRFAHSCKWQDWPLFWSGLLLFHEIIHFWKVPDLIAGFYYIFVCFCLSWNVKISRVSWFTPIQQLIVVVVIVVVYLFVCLFVFFAQASLGIKKMFACPNVGGSFWGLVDFFFTTLNHKGRTKN